jgi:hypothetical protein
MLEPSASTSSEGSGVRWIREWNRPGLRRFRIGRDGDDLLAEWWGVGTLRVTRSGRAHTFTPSPDQGELGAEPIRRTLIEGLLRHLQGKMTLHAAAAARGGRAIVIIGDSQAGKSTLVTELCLRSGFEMLADDTVFIEPGREGFDVVPTESSHSLRPDAARFFGAAEAAEPDSDKTWLPAKDVATGPARLGSIVHLKFDAAKRVPALRPIRGHEVFQILCASLFRFAIDENEAILRDFSAMAALASAVPVLELSRAPALDLLGESVGALQELPGWRGLTFAKGAPR